MKLFIISTFAVLALGCRENTEAKKANAATTKTAATQEPPPSVRSKLSSHRPLLDEVARAEIDSDGVVIDFGTPGQHKYTRGGWLTGWGSDLAASKDAVRLTSRRGFLDLVAPRTAPRAIVVRARSRTEGQRLSLHVGDRELGAIELKPEWAIHRVDIGDGAIPRAGAFRLEVRASKEATGGARAELDWLWLAASEATEAPPSATVTPLAIGGQARRALVAPTARTFTFYLQPPAGSRLVVDLGAAERAEFSVSVTTDGAEPTELAKEAIEKRWTEREISLESYAGKAIRIDLTTRSQQGPAAWGEPEIMVDEVPAPPVPAGTRPRNVILLVMDTMRADAFATFAGDKHVARTPVFDALAKKSTVFAAAYDNENWTKPSVATTLSGLYPSTHDTKHDASKLPDEVELISERLRKDGFATAGFVANGYVSDKFGFEEGWDVFKNYIRESKPSEAEYVFADALEWHAKHTAAGTKAKPYFLYLQTIDPHVTYRVDREYWSPFFEGDYSGPLGPSIDAEDQVRLSKKKIKATERDVAWLRAMYWGEVGYHDAQLGKFLAELESRKALDDTLLVITNDHGEELGERGRFGHGHQAFEEMIRAPLIVHYPPTFPAKVIPDVVEHVDVSPTIIDALGREPLKDADGESLVPLVRGLPERAPRYALIEFLDGRRILRVGSWKLFARSNGQVELFDLASDPGEKREASENLPVARRLCEIHLGEALATPDKKTRMQGLGGKRQFRSGEAVIDPQMRRQLEALGYFGSTREAKDDAK